MAIRQVIMMHAFTYDSKKMTKTIKSWPKSLNFEECLKNLKEMTEIKCKINI